MDGSFFLPSGRNLENLIDFDITITYFVKLIKIDLKVMDITEVVLEAMGTRKK